MRTLSRIACSLVLAVSAACAHPAPATGLVGAIQCHAVGGKADRHCTPGTIANSPEVLADAPRYLHTLCQPSDHDPDTKSWIQSRRPPTSYTNQLKTTQMRDYGMTNLHPRDVEEDHLVSLELDGDPRAPGNLWPEPWNGDEGAHTKDKEENSLHRQICAGTITLRLAQQQIVNDWTHP